MSQLNALELITTLASCQHGRDYLERQGIIEKLAGNLDEAPADPLASPARSRAYEIYRCTGSFSTGCIGQISELYKYDVQLDRRLRRFNEDDC